MSFWFWCLHDCTAKSPYIDDLMRFLWKLVKLIPANVFSWGIGNSSQSFKKLWKSEIITLCCFLPVSILQIIVTSKWLTISGNMFLLITHDKLPFSLDMSTHVQTVLQILSRVIEVQNMKKCFYVNLACDSFSLFITISIIKILF